jgi:prevent-host-death family protein
MTLKTLRKSTSPVPAHLASSAESRRKTMCRQTLRNEVLAARTLALSCPPERGYEAAPVAIAAIAQMSHFALNGATEMQRDRAMKTMSAREAKNGFGLTIDTARAEPVLVETHGRGVVVVVSVEEYERLSVQSGRADKGETGTKGASKGGQ